MPAAGWARRVAPLPCSKEVYPLGGAPGGGGEPNVVCHGLLMAMRAAGVRRVHVVLRPGKWDVPAYLGDGRSLGLHLAYLLAPASAGVPYTLDAAYPFAEAERVVVGFPDILFEPPDAFARLLERQAATGADVVLGLFPATDPQRVDMVEAEGDGRVRSIVVKPAHTGLRDTWLIAAWEPTFSRFMHELLAGGAGADAATELFLGHVIQAAIDDGLRVESVRFPEGRYLDLGSRGDLARAATFGLAALSHPLPL